VVLSVDPRAVVVGTRLGLTYDRWVVRPQVFAAERCAALTAGCEAASGWETAHRSTARRPPRKYRQSSADLATFGAAVVAALIEYRAHDPLTAALIIVSIVETAATDVFVWQIGCCYRGVAERRGTISAKTRHALYAASRGLCYRPGCLEHVVVVHNGLAVLVGQIAHIVAAVLSGPRGATEIEDRDGFDNLIVLCGRHHKLVDDAATRAQYPPEVLRSWKAQREAAYQESELGTSGDSPLGDSQVAGRDPSPPREATDEEQALALELLTLVDQANNGEV
jgi:hypothetical protein